MCVGYYPACRLHSLVRQLSPSTNPLMFDQFSRLIEERTSLLSMPRRKQKPKQNILRNGRRNHIIWLPVLSRAYSVFRSRCVRIVDNPSLLLTLILRKGATPRGQPPPTYLEQKRAEAQRQYTQERKYIEANRETFDKIIQQEQEAMAAQAPGSLLEMLVQAKKPEVEQEKSDQLLQPTTNPTKV